jgi:hypothetical protein
VLALGDEREEVVERGHAIDAAGGELQAPGDIVEQVVLKVAEEFLRGVEHLDQRVGREPMTLHARVEHLEPVVAARVRGGGRSLTGVHLLSTCPT